MAQSHLGDMIRNGVLHTAYLLAPKPTARAVDLSGRHILVTGASSGSLGYETARTLATWGAHVVVTAVDEWRGLEDTLREDLRARGHDATRVSSRGLDLGGIRRLRGLAARLSSLVLLKPAQGAQTAIHCASAPNIRGGSYYERCAVSRPSADALDPLAAARLWEQSQDWIASLPR